MSIVAPFKLAPSRPRPAEVPRARRAAPVNAGRASAATELTAEAQPTAGPLATRSNPDVTMLAVFWGRQAG